MRAFSLRFRQQGLIPDKYNPYSALSYFTCLLPNKSFQSRLFRLSFLTVFYCAHLHQLALLRIQEGISVQGSFRTCWE
ncbi:MAG: hypothetical protein PHX56_08505 [Atribacterota bacterium]|nr:hypothetical protein [Atribacterota bacterium]